MKKPKEVWAFIAGSRGLSCRGPIKMKWDASYQHWHHAKSDIYIEGIGLKSGRGWVTFASTDWNAVNQFAQGYQQACQMLLNMTRDE